MIYSFDLAATFVFGLCGAFKAVKYELDLLGVILLSVVTGIGGGVVRDILFCHTTPSAFLNPDYMLVSVLSGLIVFLYASRIAIFWDVVLLLDSVGIALFTCIGAFKVSEIGHNYIGIIISGVLSSVGGGVIRDAFVGEINDVFKDDLYASASIAGSVMYCLTGSLSLCFMLVFVIRLIAMKYKLNLPKVKMLPKPPSIICKERK